MVLPEGEVTVLQALARWGAAHLRLEALLRRDGKPGIAELGELAWLRVFDKEDLNEFVAELEESLIAAHADKSVESLKSCIEAWRATARQLEDPLRREILLRGRLGPDDLVEAKRPADADGSNAP